MEWWKHIRSLRGEYVSTIYSSTVYIDFEYTAQLQILSYLRDQCKVLVKIN
jgi:hypothetical protein